MSLLISPDTSISTTPDAGSPFSVALSSPLHLGILYSIEQLSIRHGVCWGGFGAVSLISVCISVFTMLSYTVLSNCEIQPTGWVGGRSHEGQYFG